MRNGLATHAIPPLIAALFLFSLGVVSFLSGRKEIVWSVFSGFCFLLTGAAIFAFLALTSTDMALVERYLRLVPSCFFLSFTFAMFYIVVLTGQPLQVRWFGWTFSVKLKRGESEIILANRPISVRLYFGAVAVFWSVLLLVFNATDWLVVGVTQSVDGVEMHYGPLIWFASGIVLIAVGKISFILNQARRMSSSRALRNFVSWNMLAFCVMYTPALMVSLVVPFLGFTALVSLFLLLVVAVVIFYIAILRYQFARIEELNVGLEEKVEERTAALEHTQVRLAQSEQMATLGQLVAGVAHEINNPIGSVRSMHGSLILATKQMKQAIEQDPPELESLQRLLALIDDANGVIDTGTERVAEIVKRLKSFARLDEAQLQRVDITGGLDDTLALLERELEDTLSVKREYNGLPPIYCFPGLLNQVWANLLCNAKDAIAGSGRGQVTIRSSEDEERVYVDITDNGRGIPENVQRKVFDPGFTTKGVGVGTGLGLSICYQIVKDHHGDLTVESKVGDGSTFTVALPKDLDRRLA